LCRYDAAAADDTESFVLAYGLLVQSMPELGLEPAERLLAAREDIPRATQREVIEVCKELLHSHLATTQAAAGGAGKSSKWKAAATSKALRFA
jgi:exocyst complex component 3